MVQKPQYEITNIDHEPRKFLDRQTGKWVVLPPKGKAFTHHPVESSGVFRVEQPEQKKSAKSAEAKV